MAGCSQGWRFQWSELTSSSVSRFPLPACCLAVRSSRQASYEVMLRVRVHDDIPRTVRRSVKVRSTSYSSRTPYSTTQHSTGYNLYGLQEQQLAGTYICVVQRCRHNHSVMRSFLSTSILFLKKHARNKDIAHNYDEH